MPIKDPQKKREATRAWRERVMPQGYGKWLYARRKLRFDDEARFRDALETIEAMAGAAGSGEVPAMAIAQVAREALGESREAEEALGPWTPPD